MTALQSTCNTDPNKYKMSSNLHSFLELELRVRIRLLKLFIVVVCISISYYHIIVSQIALMVTSGL